MLSIGQIDIAWIYQGRLGKKSPIYSKKGCAIFFFMDKKVLSIPSFSCAFLFDFGETNAEHTSPSPIIHCIHLPG